MNSDIKAFIVLDSQKNSVVLQPVYYKITAQLCDYKHNVLCTLIYRPVLLLALVTMTEKEISTKPTATTPSTRDQHFLGIASKWNEPIFWLS